MTENARGAARTIAVLLLVQLALAAWLLTKGFTEREPASVMERT
jgi:hypothetical protein